MQQTLKKKQKNIQSNKKRHFTGKVFASWKKIVRNLSGCFSALFKGTRKFRYVSPRNEHSTHLPSHIPRYFCHACYKRKSTSTLFTPSWRYKIIIERNTGYLQVSTFYIATSCNWDSDWTALASFIYVFVCVKQKMYLIFIWDKNQVSSSDLLYCF